MKHENGTFFQIPRNITIGLPYRQKLVLMCLWSYVSTKDWTCFPSTDTISAWCGITKKTVIKAIKELEESHRILVNRRFGSGKKKMVNIYTVMNEEQCISASGFVITKKEFDYFIKFSGVNKHRSGVKEISQWCKLDTVTRTTELEPKELKPINTSLSKESDELIISFLFKAVSIDELESKIISVLPIDWAMTWKQTLCAAFDVLKTVEEIWEHSRFLLGVESDFDTPPLNKHSINTVDEAIRMHGHDYESIQDEVKESGWEEWNTYLRVGYK